MSEETEGQLTHHRYGPRRPEREYWWEHDDAQVGVHKAHPHDHAPENLRQLVVGQRQRPQPEVAGGVGDGAEDVLDGVNTWVGNI